MHALPDLAGLCRACEPRGGPGLAELSCLGVMGGGRQSWEPATLFGSCSSCGAATATWMLLWGLQAPGTWAPSPKNPHPRLVLRTQDQTAGFHRLPRGHPNPPAGSPTDDGTGASGLLPETPSPPEHKRDAR